MYLGMYTDQGNHAAKMAVWAVPSKRINTMNQANVEAMKIQKILVNRGFREADDTMVRECLFDAIAKQSKVI